MVIELTAIAFAGVLGLTLLLGPFLFARATIK